MKLTVSNEGDYLECGGAPFFYLADTMWSAFVTPTLEEWEEYLTHRQRQGFNTVQICVLPHDEQARLNGHQIPPFLSKPDGKWDLGRVNPAYFDHAEQILDKAAQYGFKVALVLLWWNYINYTWDKGSWDHNPHGHDKMDAAMVKSYVTYALSRFARFDPMYIISGDTDFATETSVPLYKTALDTVRALAPGALTTMHLSPQVTLPEALEGAVDVYMYQAGHSLAEQDKNRKLAAHYAALAPKRPVINGEPCYEGHGFGAGCGRFSREHIRQAFWSSLLGGAKAGFTYGSPALRRFSREGFLLSEHAKRRIKEPFHWRDALRMPGAGDVVFGKFLFETYDMYTIRPMDRVLEFPEDIPMAGKHDLSLLVFYTPSAADIVTDVDLSGYEVTMFELGQREIYKPKVTVHAEKSVIRMLHVNSDALVIAKRGG